jgi:Raf kinase inhibitor-like YbhB/YbcL family protein
MRAWLLVLVGCSSSAKAIDARDITTFTLTSSALADNAAFDPANTCDGVDTSPALAWSGAPSDTQSFAVVLLDNTISLVHWVIYDIPPAAMALPAAIDTAYAPVAVPGAHQTVSFSPPIIGYQGPCPPRLHTYQFTVYALDVASLPGASMTTAGGDALATIEEHRTATGMLTGTYVRP